MTTKTFCVVTTTINVPTLLAEYAADAARFGRKVEQFIVVGDLKTPAGAAEFCRGVEQDYGVRCHYVSPDEQRDYLKDRPAFAEFLPWNCIQRRNVGLLLAAAGRADIVVTIDDDNFICQADYLGRHAHLGEIREFEAVRNQSGWWNVCEMLESSQGIRFYHRGHPLSKRWTAEEEFQTRSVVRGRAVVNAGLWLDDPDVDALTRLYFPIRVPRTSPLYRDTIAADLGTWAPFNSQNTALLREVIPAYLLFPRVGRYDDIWASYVVRHIADHRGDYVTYGAPLVRQKRNPHNYLKDFDDERLGLEYTDIFLEALRGCRLKAADYAGAFAEIAAQFPGAISAACEAHRRDPKVFADVSRGLELWTGACRNGG